MEWKISILSEELEKLGSRISDDLKNTLVSLDGNLKDIDNGTHIKIPMDAGFVKAYRSLNSLSLTVYMTDSLSQDPQAESELYDEYLDNEADLNTTKSDKL